MQIDLPAVPLQKINDEITSTHEIELYLMRTDLNDLHISGNKLYKLKYNLEAAQRTNKETLLTFGGAFSNHIAAVAAAGKKYGFKTIGIIRGEKHEPLNPTLEFAITHGMQLDYVSRECYQNKAQLEQYVQKNHFNERMYLIPEGGNNELGILGCTTITNQLQIPFDYICCACGTGTTLTGIIRSLKREQHALGFQVLKGENYMQTEISKQLEAAHHSQSNWSIHEDYHFGGYAKIKNTLLTFMNEFEARHHVALEPIYTGKMMFGIYDLIQRGFFKKGEVIIAVHTGGLQAKIPQHWQFTKSC